MYKTERGHPLTKWLLFIQIILVFSLYDNMILMNNYEEIIETMQSTRQLNKKIIKEQKNKIAVINDKYDSLAIKKVTATAYTISADETDSTPTIGALNKKVTVGKSIAVSHDLLYLLGKKVYIKGIGVRVVEDIMNPRHVAKIDILVRDKQKAISFGKKQVRLCVLN